MNWVDAALAQIRNHPIRVVIADAKRNVVLGRMAVNDPVHEKEAEHPSDVSVAVQEQRARIASPTEAELKAELLHVKLDRAIDVCDWKMNFVEALVRTHAPKYRGLTGRMSLRRPLRIRQRLAASGAGLHPHAIKFTDACLREYAPNPSRCAAYASARLRPSGYVAGPLSATSTTWKPSGSASVTPRIFQYGFAASTGSAAARLHTSLTASALPT